MTNEQKKALVGKAFLKGWEACISALRKAGHNKAADAVYLPPDDPEEDEDPESG